MKSILGMKITETDPADDRVSKTCDDPDCQCYRPTTEYASRRASILNLKG